MKDIYMNEYADMLHRARLMSQPIEQLTAAGAKLSRSDAYDIQEQGINLRHQDGELLVGLKMGLTSEAKRTQMNLDSPL